MNESQPTTSGALSARARRIHDEALVLDAHIDLGKQLVVPGWQFRDRHAPPPAPGAEGSHMDLPRMREAGIDAAFFAVFIPGTIVGAQAVADARRQVAAIHVVVSEHPGDLALCTTAAEVRATTAAGKIAVLMGIEGGHMIADDLDVLREYARAGARYLTLTHVVNVSWADSSFDAPRSHGLTPFGKQLVAELNRLGMMVDVSHVSDETFWDAIAASRAPIIASHSSCRALCSTPRNLTDEMVRAVAKCGGFVGINFMSVYLDDEAWREHGSRRQFHVPSVSWKRILDHIDHAVNLAGVDAVGLGPDFYDCAMPTGMEDCTGFPRLTEALLARGYRESDVVKILGENMLTVMARVEAVGHAKTGGS